jgi:sterol 3beta-glucosyltransferase
MKVTLISYGTEGDTRPFVALGHGFIQAGHDAIFLGERSGAPLADSVGVPFHALAGDIRAAIGELISSGVSPSPSRIARSIAELGTQQTQAWMKTLLEHCYDSDAIVCSGLTSYVALSVAQHLKIPLIGAGLQPFYPTHEFPNPFLASLPFPKFCNRLTHLLMMWLFWKSFQKAINAARKAVTGQPPQRAMWRDYPVLFGISPQLISPPKDWPEHICITGDWALPSPLWEPPRQLACFLAAGPAPVYVGFGSMVGFDRRKVVKAVVAALDGRRALLAGGWSNIDRSGLPDNILMLEATPHDHLFRSVSMVIFHGGAGTTHTTARAGVPSVVIPFAGDQFFWGEQLARKGLAAAPLPYSKLTAEELRWRLRQAETPEIRTRAQEVGHAMRAASGVTNAVKIIEKLARSEK